MNCKTYIGVIIMEESMFNILELSELEEKIKLLTEIIDENNSIDKDSDKIEL
jgi:hypothetical protein